MNSLGTEAFRYVWKNSGRNSYIHHVLEEKLKRKRIRQVERPEGIPETQDFSQVNRKRLLHERIGMEVKWGGDSIILVEQNEHYLNVSCLNKIMLSLNKANLVKPDEKPNRF